jgi:ssDNA-binding Zn-finger/Zn-ribbon topoisomerase 1
LPLTLMKCSHEHMPHLEPPAADLLKKRLLEILSATQPALKALEAPDEEVKVRKWQCPSCDYTKNFSRPANAMTAQGCPKCSGRELVPLAD